MALSIESVLRTLGAPLSEAQLWALTHGAAEALLELQRSGGGAQRLQDARAIITTKSVTVSADGAVGINASLLRTTEGCRADVHAERRGARRRIERDMGVTVVFSNACTEFFVTLRGGCSGFCTMYTCVWMDSLFLLLMFVFFLVFYDGHCILFSRVSLMTSSPISPSLPTTEDDAEHTARFLPDEVKQKRPFVDAEKVRHGNSGERAAFGPTLPSASCGSSPAVSSINLLPAGACFFARSTAVQLGRLLPAGGRGAESQRRLDGVYIGSCRPTSNSVFPTHTPTDLEALIGAMTDEDMNERCTLADVLQDCRGHVSDSKVYVQTLAELFRICTSLADSVRETEAAFEKGCRAEKHLLLTALPYPNSRSCCWWSRGNLRARRPRRQWWLARRRRPTHRRMTSMRSSWTSYINHRSCAMYGTGQRRCTVDLHFKPIYCLAGQSTRSDRPSTICHAAPALDGGCAEGIARDPQTR